MTGAGTTELLRADGLGPVGAGADESRLVSISDANQQLNADEPIDSPIMRSSVMSSPRLDYVSQFEVNRAKVEAVLKRNSEPQFMRRI
ncbi:unnamed protein product [Anisakis simplex]|uniref:Flagellar M-ring protein n=1 Tax=Anisakis simplex TaxID=6269 RepID=A0A0M3IYM7_ANISI|nr:unnamed protein product [Anisakis simplex]